MHTRRAVAVLAALLVSACSGNPVGQPQAVAPVLAPVLAPEAAARPPIDTLVRAAALVGEQRGYNFSFELTLRGLPETGGAPLAISGSGTMDLPQERSAVRLDLAGLLAAARLAGESSAQFDAILGDGRIDLIQDGSTVYLKMPFLAREAGVTTGVTTPWVSMTMPNGAGAAGEPLPGILGQLGGAGSPAGYLARLQAVDGSVIEDGTGSVRGVATTRYRGTLDLAKLLGHAAPMSEAPQFDAMMPFFQALKLPYEVWVDAEGLPRRLTTTLDFGTFAPAGTPTLEPAPALSFTYDLFDFGAPAAIELPASGDVTALDPAVLGTLR